MKRNLCLVLLAQLLLVLPSSAYDFKVDGIFYNVVTLDDGTRAAEVTHSSDELPNRDGAPNEDYVGDIVIPPFVDFQGETLPVASIGPYAFCWDWYVTSVAGMESVRKIGANAFYLCGLQSIRLPEGLTAVGAGAFNACGNLESVVLPESLASVGSYAFYMSGLREVSLPSSMTEIPTACFMATMLKSIVLPSSLTSIGSMAFSECQFTSIDIPSQVREIGSSAFAGTPLSSLTLPDSLVSLGYGAIAECAELRQLILPKGLKSMGVQKLCLTEGLESVVSGMEAPPACPFTYAAEIGEEEDYVNEHTALSIPYGTRAAYEQAGWLRFFKNVVEIQPTAITVPFPDSPGVNGKSVNSKSVNSKCLDLAGRPLSTTPMRRGIYIRDGKKVTK